MQRFNRPRLIGFDDPAYQRHVEHMKLQRANQRAIRPPSQRDLFGGEVETLLRTTLAARFSLSDRRILEYEERIGRNVTRKYRELDALVIEGQQRAHVFEIKASRRAGALHRALKQLRDTQAILKLLFRAVSATVLFVDTGTLTAAEQADIAAAEQAPERLPQTLADAIAEHPEARQVGGLHEIALFPDRVELAVIAVEEVIALAQGAPLSLDWEADEIDGEEPAPPPPAVLYSTPDDDDDENPFAAALRKAGGKSPR